VRAGERASDALVVHQTLHGYENGHRLIAGSLRLPPAVRTAMLLLSDMSGPTMVPGFESYITGYPLFESSLYVLARTWYAPEMERPGCVWTHSLLIRFADLAGVHSLAALEQHFRRPARDPDAEEYQLPLEIVADPVSMTRPIELATFLPSLLRSLYGTMDSAVVPVAKSIEVENTVLRVWDQQWPRLRRSFSFCTGAIAPRELNGTPFDLQIVPRVNERLFAVADRIQVVQYLAPPLEEDWLTLSTNDIKEGRPSKLRAFLWTFGADVDHERMSYRPLVEAYRLAQETSTQPIGELVALAATAFPEPSNAERLKRWILGDSRAGLPLFPSIDHSLILPMLLQGNVYQAFGKERVSEVVTDFTARTDDRTRRRLLENLLAQDTNRLGRQLTADLLQRESINYLISMLRTHRTVSRKVLELRPDIATSKEFWAMSHDELEELFPIIQEQAAKRPELLGGMIRGMIAAGSSWFIEESIEAAGLEAVDAIFEGSALSGADEEQLQQHTRRALQKRPNLVIEWLQRTPPKPSQLQFAATVLDPNTEAVRDLGMTVWLPVLPSPLDARPQSMAVRCFLLALAFSNPTGHAEAVVAETFQPLRNNADNAENWFMLEPHLPRGSSWFWGEWERSERLTRALVDHFIQYRWPPLQLLRAVRDRQTLEDVVTYCEGFDLGRKLLRELTRTVPHLPRDAIKPFMTNVLQPPKKRKKK